jgi:hypothetical protein
MVTRPALHAVGAMSLDGAERDRGGGSPNRLTLSWQGQLTQRDARDFADPSSGV